MTEKEKNINLAVQMCRDTLHQIMREIEPKNLYEKCVALDKQLYAIKEILSSVK